VLLDVNELLKVHHSLRRNEVSVRPPDADVLAEINGANLIQLLLNLAINALQCSPDPHRVELSVSTPAEPLPLDRWLDGAETHFVNREGFRNQLPLIAITVKDDGPGIAPDVLTRIFQPRTFEEYFSTKAGGEGHGLGMAIVQRFIRESRGGLRVQTQMGSGTVFTVYLSARS
jgi:signal transduction histidine kinase